MINKIAVIIIYIIIYNIINNIKNITLYKITYIRLKKIKYKVKI